MEPVALPLERQQFRTISWRSPVQGSGLSEVLCALRERHEAASLAVPTLSLPLYSGTDYEALLSALSKTGSIDDRNALMQQMHTAILGLAGQYVTTDCVLITAPDLAALGIKASGATWEDRPALTTALRVLQYRRSVVRTIAQTFPLNDAGPATYRYASWLLPRTVGGKDVAGYALNTFSSNHGGQTRVEPFLANQPRKLLTRYGFTI